MESAWRNRFFERSKSRFKDLIPIQKNNKVYIIPTLFGVFFTCILLVMLYAAFASGNNFLYLYTFFLTSLGVSSLWLTHINISGIKIDHLKVEEVFADNQAQALVHVYNSSSKVRHYIEVFNSPQKSFVISEIAPHSFYQIRIDLGTYKRGVHALPPLKLNTTFPFFLLKSWKTHRAVGDFIVFPKREGSSNLPFLRTEQETSKNETLKLIKNSNLDFFGHRRFEPSDSIRQVDWKAYARTDKILVKEYQGNDPQEIMLDWQMTSKIQDFESRLSQLALWIEIAESKGYFYSLNLPEMSCPISRGRHHYLNCLKSLALFKKDPLLEA